MQRHQRQYPALGSTAVITLVTHKPAAYAEKLLTTTQERITKFEHQFSRFLSDSELTQFNKNAGQKTVVSASFFALLRESRKLSEATGSLYNPFILPTLQDAGYLYSWTDPKTTQPDVNFTNRRLVDATQLVLGDTWAKIPPHSALDFGGIGKGYLLDELHRFLSQEELTGYWLSLGGDILCAGYDLDKQEWRIAVQHAINPDEIVGHVMNSNGGVLAVATSGVTKRKGVKRGAAWHHIIDPRTNRPSRSSVLTATVTAKKGVLADVYAKCIVIEGVEQAELYQRQGHIQTFVLQLDNNKTIIGEQGVTRA